jgi:DNA-binding NarL/FixJ family response regulator
MSVRLVLTEPRRLVREALEEALSVGHGLVVVATADDAASTVLQAKRVAADVVVVAAALRDPLPQLCADLHQLKHRPRTIVLDGTGDEETLLQAIESGVDGYVTGASGLEGLGEAIRAIARGESVVPPAMLGPLLRRLIERRREATRAADRLDTLTPREREVLALLVEGRDQAGIAGVLFISPETARTHVQRVLRKLGVHSRLEAVTLVAQTGLADRLERLVERSAS